MRAVVLQRARRLNIVEKPIPEPGPGEVLIRLEACGLSNRDFDAWYHGQVQLPRVLGSEIVGRVVSSAESKASPAKSELGGGQTTRRGTEDAKIIPLYPSERRSLEPGTRVVLSPYVETPGDGGQRLLGRDLDGGLQEYICCPREQCYPVSDSRSLIELACVAGLAEALAIVDEMNLGGRETVVVSGAEELGTFVALATALRGGVPVLVDTSQARLEQARAAGVERIVNPFRSSVPDELEWIAPSGKADVVIETSGNRNALPGLFANLLPGSKVGFTRSLDYDISVAALVESGLRLVGLGTTLPNIEEAIDLVRGTEVVKMVTATVPLAEIPDKIPRIARARKGIIKIVVTATA
jgi:threonine 3-dehydrogenase